MTAPVSAYEEHIRKNPKRWLITGCAGFIGSHILERLLTLNQTVVGIDNFDTGSLSNLDAVKSIVGDSLWKKFVFIEGDICDQAVCSKGVDGATFVLHQAARGSVPRSIADPLGTNKANVTGFVSILEAAARAKVKAFVYASSSSVYGDNAELPKKEDNIGRQLSPYAVSKRVNELYAFVFSQHFALNTIGFRYFNVFGPRQNPKGPYAAVIPLWMHALGEGKQCTIFGDGKTSRDFCYVSNVVQANLRAASYLEDKSAESHIFNIGGGRSTSLEKLHELIGQLAKARSGQPHPNPAFAPFRKGDIQHSLADISKAQSILSYAPEVSIEEGLKLMSDSLK